MNVERGVRRLVLTVSLGMLVSSLGFVGHTVWRMVEAMADAEAEAAAQEAECAYFKANPLPWDPADPQLTEAEVRCILREVRVEGGYRRAGSMVGLEPEARPLGTVPDRPGRDTR